MFSKSIPLTLAPYDTNVTIKSIKVMDVDGYEFSLELFPELDKPMELISRNASFFILKIIERNYKVQISLDWSFPGEGTISFIETAEDADPLNKLELTEYPNIPEYGWLDNTKVYVPKRNPDVQLYGQPDFIQNPVYPSKNGKLYYPLMVINNGWGDSGNINIFVHLDANGYPEDACLEASCC